MPGRKCILNEPKPHAIRMNMKFSKDEMSAAAI